MQNKSKKNRKYTIKRSKKNRKHTVKRQCGGSGVKRTFSSIKGTKGLIDSPFMQFRGSEVTLHVNNLYEELILFKLEPKSANEQEQDIKSRIFMTYVAQRDDGLKKKYIGKQKWVPVFKVDDTNQTNDKCHNNEIFQSKIKDFDILNSVINIIIEWFTLYDSLGEIIKNYEGRDWIHCKVQGKLRKLIKKRKDNMYNKSIKSLNIDKQNYSTNEPNSIANLALQESFENNSQNLNIESMVNKGNQLYFGMKVPDEIEIHSEGTSSHVNAIEEWKRAITHVSKNNERNSKLIAELDVDKLKKLKISELKALENALNNLLDYDVKGRTAEVNKRRENYNILKNTLQLFQSKIGT